jgi:hypothetical protein
MSPCDGCRLCLLTHPRLIGMCTGTIDRAWKQVSTLTSPARLMWRAYKAAALQRAPSWSGAATLPPVGAGARRVIHRRTSQPTPCGTGQVTARSREGVT